MLHRMILVGSAVRTAVIKVRTADPTKNRTWMRIRHDRRAASHSRNKRVRRRPRRRKGLPLPSGHRLEPWRGGGQYPWERLPLLQGRTDLLPDPADNGEHVGPFVP